MPSMTKIQAEYDEIDQGKLWETLFETLRQKSQNSFTYDDAKKIENRKLNRYRDVNPYDHSRIKLNGGSVDYINANLVELERANRRYILTQGPLQSTLEHFWLMVWEQNSRVILMLNKIIEKNQIKCHMYWPKGIGPDYTLVMREVGLSLEYLKYEEYNNYSKRTFRLTNLETSVSREILQFHYMTWPDFGIPSSPLAFLHFLRVVRNSGGLSSDVGPAVVHCSAGIGRSGTFCLVDCCLVLVDKEGEDSVSIQEVLLELRQFRMGLIQTVEQLLFSYQAIIEGIKCFQDPEFLSYEEMAKEGIDHEDDNPPPLPPRRTISLAGINSLQPGSGGVDDNANADRPLPPVPGYDEESESEEEQEDGLVDSSESNESEASDLQYEWNNVNPIKAEDLELKLNGDEPNHSEENMEQGNAASGNEDASNDSVEPPTPKKFKTTSNGDAPFEDVANSSSAGIPKKPIVGSSEIKRRTRKELNTAVDEKVKEIKRKQEELEALSARKRKQKSVLIGVVAGVGVVLGLVCIYSVLSK